MLEHEVQLVVMASHCRNMVEEFFVGSVSHDIARHAEASVLFIPSVHPIRGRFNSNHVGTLQKNNLAGGCHGVLAALPGERIKNISVCS